MVFIVLRKMYPYYQSIFHVSSVACDRSRVSQAGAHHISLSTLISHAGIKDYHFLSQEVFIALLWRDLGLSRFRKTVCLRKPSVHLTGCLPGLLCCDGSLKRAGLCVCYAFMSA